MAAASPRRVKLAQVARGRGGRPRASGLGAVVLMGYGLMPRPADTREAIIVAASQLIHASSYHAVSVDDICVAAGVRKGSFYHFFASKKLLVLAILGRQRRVCSEYLFEPASKVRRSPAQRVARIFDQLYASHQHDRKTTGHVIGCPFGNLAVEMATKDEDIRAASRAVFDDFTAYFAAAVGGGARGKVVGEQLTAHLEGVVLLAKAHDDLRFIRRGRAGALLLMGAARSRVSRRPAG